MKRKTEKKELKSLINKEGKSKIILRLTKNYLKNAYFDLEYSVVHEFFYFILGVASKFNSKLQGFIYIYFIKA